MVELQNAKVVQAVKPGAIKDDAAWTGEVIDTQGFEYAIVVCQFGATDVTLAALKLTECATSGGSFSDVPGCIVGTSANIEGDTSVLPGATDDDTFVVFQVDLRGRQRYLKVAATAGNGTLGTYMSAMCLLGRGHELPRTMAQRGALQVMAG